MATRNSAVAIDLVKRSRQERILHFIGSNDLPQSTSDIANALNLSGRTARRVLHEMAECDLVLRVDGWIIATTNEPLPITE